MQVTLNHHTGLEHIISGIRICWKSQDKSDNGGPKDIALIKRIALKLKHSSVLRHSLYVFNCQASTKTLLAFTRHSVGVNFGVESTRYTTSKQGSSISFTPSRSDFVNERLDKVLVMVHECIKQGISDDDIALLLPQAYNYTFQVSMNAQALQHFFQLRGGVGSHAHYDINSLANAMFECLPSEQKFLFDHCIQHD